MSCANCDHEIGHHTRKDGSVGRCYHRPQKPNAKRGRYNPDWKAPACTCPVFILKTPPYAYLRDRRSPEPDKTEEP